MLNQYEKLYMKYGNPPTHNSNCKLFQVKIRTPDGQQVVTNQCRCGFLHSLSYFPVDHCVVLYPPYAKEVGAAWMARMSQRRSNRQRTEISGDSMGPSSNYVYAGEKLSGINDLKGKYAGQSAIVCCSGTTLMHYRNDIAPLSWPRIAVNEAIKKLGPLADFWVLSDDPIAIEYGEFCDPRTTILCMQQATRIIRRHCPQHKIHTVESMPKPGKYENGYQFYSRGTVMIGAIEMARFMGITRFFIFGLDCYRTKKQYYFDNRRPAAYSENNFNENSRVRSDSPDQIYVTPKLKNMVEKLNVVAAAKIWKSIEVFCVNSPYSQQRAIQLMDIYAFKRLCDEDKAREAQRPPQPAPAPTQTETTPPEPLVPTEDNEDVVEETIYQPEPDQAEQSEPEAPRRRGRPRKKTIEDEQPEQRV